MDKSAIIFLGTGGHPNYCWYGWLGARLEARGYVVEIPHYPGLNRDPIETFLPTVLASHVLQLQGLPDKFLVRATHLRRLAAPSDTSRKGEAPRRFGELPARRGFRCQ
jgi:hypothetical protein